jgi:hypothetical protein
MSNVTKKIELAKAYLVANERETTSANVIGVMLDPSLLEHTYYSLLWLKYNDLHFVQCCKLVMFTLL